LQGFNGGTQRSSFPICASDNEAKLIAPHLWTCIILGKKICKVSMVVHEGWDSFLGVAPEKVSTPILWISIKDADVKKLRREKVKTRDGSYGLLRRSIRCNTLLIRNTRIIQKRIYAILGGTLGLHQPPSNHHELASASRTL
jgi:hypothetical protein